MTKVKDLEARILYLEQELEKYKQIVFTYPIKQYNLTCKIVEEYDTEFLTTSLKEAKERAKEFSAEDIRTDWNLRSTKIIFTKSKQKKDISDNNL